MARKHLGDLYKMLAPPQVSVQHMQFTSHDCTIVDKALKPELAAVGLVSVLGIEYCEELITVLQAEIQAERIRQKHLMA